MLDYIRRMEQEKTDLEGKLRKALNALKKADDIHLDKTQRVLLDHQVGFMMEYLEVLKARIIYEKKYTVSKYVF